MRLKTHMLKWLLIAAFLALPVVAWAFFKPVRVLAPELAGVSCQNESICIDDPTHYAEVSKLYDEAFEFVSSVVGEMKQKPRVIFCTTESCFQSFGFKHGSAKNVGPFGIVIGPHAWKPYYIRHEMIHRLQYEHLGTLKGWLFMPEWFMEGMAYSLSEDPRPDLGKPFQQYRSQFEIWYQKVGKDALWVEAAKL